MPLASWSTTCSDTMPMRESEHSWKSARLGGRIVDADRCIWNYFDAWTISRGLCADRGTARRLRRRRQDFLQGRHARRRPHPRLPGQAERQALGGLQEGCRRAEQVIRDMSSALSLGCAASYLACNKRTEQ